MKIFLAGATGVMGASAARALVAAGHDVAGLARTEAKARSLEAVGVTPVSVNLFDTAQLTAAFTGYDVVCNLATHMPVALSRMVRPGAWKLNDRIRTEGSRVVVEAAAGAGVRRLIQESVSCVYADGGDSWIDEQSPLTVTRATEPVAVAETNALSFACASRDTVVLRFGHIVGDEALAWWRTATTAVAGDPVVLGDPRSWAHVIHPDDVGAAVVAALSAPGGIYNVGAAPVQRQDLNEQMFAVAGRAQRSYMPKVVARLAGERIEPLTRSHRISSRLFHDVGGWRPRHPAFAHTWLQRLVPTP